MYDAVMDTTTTASTRQLAPVQDPWVALNASIDAMRGRFEAHIGYISSDSAYRAGIERLLSMALSDGKTVWNGESLSIVVDDPTWESGKLTLSMDPGRPKLLGVFGAYGGREAGLMIRNGPYPHSVWVVGKIKWELVTQAANDLVNSGRLRRDDALKLFVFMIPRGTRIA